MKKVTMYTEEERVAYLQAWKKSGLTQKAFSEQQGLCLRTFNNWKTSRIPEKRRSSLKSDEFVEMKPVEVKEEKESSIRITLGHYKVTVDQGFTPAVLADVLTVLEARDVH